MEEVRRYGSFAFLGIAVAIFSLSLFNSAKNTEKTKKTRQKKVEKKRRTKDQLPSLEENENKGSKSQRKIRRASLKPIFEIDESTIVDDTKPQATKIQNKDKKKSSNELRDSFIKTPDSTILKKKENTLGASGLWKGKKLFFVEEEDHSSERTIKPSRKAPPKKSTFLSDTDHQKVKKQENKAGQALRKNEDDFYFYMLDQVVATFDEND